MSEMGKEEKMNIGKIGYKFLKAMEIKLFQHSFGGMWDIFRLNKWRESLKNSVFGDDFPPNTAEEIANNLLTEGESRELASLMKKLREKRPRSYEKSHSEINEIIEKYKDVKDREVMVVYKVFKRMRSELLDLLGLIKTKKERFLENYNFLAKMISDLGTKHGREYHIPEIKEQFSKALKSLAELVNKPKKEKTKPEKETSSSESTEKKSEESEGVAPPNPIQNQKEPNQKKEPDSSSSPEKTNSQNVPESSTNAPSSTGNNKDNQTSSLHKLKTEVIATISEVMMEEIKVNDYDLPENDRQWKKMINQSNDAEYIASLKERLLIIIQQIKKEKKNNNELLELVKKGETTNNPEELKKIIEQIEEFRGEKIYDSLKQEIKNLKKKLADQDIEGYRITNCEMIEKELEKEEIKASDLDMEVQKKHEKLKKKGEIKQEEIEAIKDEVSNNTKLKGAEKKLEKLLEDYQNGSSERKKEILKKIISFINNSNFFYQQIYQKNKHKIDSLLKKTKNLKRNSPQSNSNFPVEVKVIGGGAILAALMFFLIKAYKKRNYSR